MKKLIAILAILAIAAASAVGLVACKGTDEHTIVVGASSTPHAEILAVVKDALLSQGYTLKIVTYDDYVLPNLALEEGSLDANYFQHTPYLNTFNAQKGTHLVAVDKIHYEPFGVYGKGVTQADFDTVKTGRRILVPDDGSNCTRALFVLQEQGYITLNADAKATDNLSDKDILDGRGNTVILVKAENLAAQLGNADSGTLAVINGNYALAAGLDVRNALAIENATGEAASLYANVIAVKQGHQNDAKIQALVTALKSQAVADYIQSHYEGAVKVAF